MEFIKPYLPIYIVEKIKSIPILIIELEDKLMWIFTPLVKFTIKTIAWEINDSINCHPKAKFLNSIC